MTGSRTRFVSPTTLALTLAAAFAIAPLSAHAQKENNRELNKSEQAAHVLSRLTFGARPGDLQHVSKLGVDKWIKQQLHPSSLSESAAIAALATLRPWTLAPEALLVAGPQIGAPEAAMMGMQFGPTTQGRVSAPISFTSSANEFVTGKIIRAQLSERQLEEVMVDFWLNHFSVFSGKMPSVDAIVAYERNVIRPRALGKFRDLVGAVAHSPAMLFI